jgi:hypothetical protein
VGIGATEAKGTHPCDQLTLGQREWTEFSLNFHVEPFEINRWVRGFEVEAWWQLTPMNAEGSFD